jgi:transposase
MHKDEDIKEHSRKRRKPEGWMFWGSFAGRRRGPSFIWPKEYGGVNRWTYTREIVPLVAQYYHREGISLFQHDNAPGHRARYTKDALQAAGVELLPWPPYSPDLAPIENVWPYLVEEIEARCEDIQELTEDQLYQLIWIAWFAISEDFFLTLAHSMPRRLQACIDAGGSTIKY